MESTDIEMMDKSGVGNVSNTDSKSSPLTNTASMLPPCRVCGEKASGFHYGANTCEACKGFFRRSLKKKGEYKCMNNKDCNIGPGKRNGCPKCRYKICLDIGMSKEAIKTGRYTHQKRTENILKIKELQNRSKNMTGTVAESKDNVTTVPLTISGTTSFTNLDSSAETNISSINMESQNEEVKISTFAQNFFKTIHCPDYLLGDDNNLRLLSEIVLEDSETTFRESNVSPTIPGNKSASPLNSKSDSPLSATCSSTEHENSVSDFEDVDRLEVVIETLKSVHLEHVKCLSLTKQEDIESKQFEYKEKYQIRTDMFGKLSMLPMEQYNEFYSMTGIDIDNRQEQMVQIATTMEDGIRRLILFAKSIPGFTDLTTSDKSNLIKASRFEFFLLGHYKGHNSKLMTMLTPAGQCVCAEEVTQFLPPEFLHKCFRFSDSMKKLAPTFEEIVILKAIVLLFRDRCELIEPEKVEKIQWQLIQCLMYTVKKHRPDQPNYFTRYMDRLMEIRSLTELNYKFSKNLLVWPFIQKSHLLFEILSF